MSLTVLGSNGGGEYNLESSLRFRSSASANLTYTNKTATDRTAWTYSFWVKRSRTGVYDTLFAFRTAGTVYSELWFTSNDNLRFSEYNGAIIGELTSTAVYRDLSAWYHIVFVWDSANATSTDRCRLYVNGERITSFSATGFPAQNTLTLSSTPNQELVIGRENYIPQFPFDGYMTEIHSVDGQALTADDFGEYDSTTGVWKPKEYTGTYGTNGFYLPFKETQQATGFNTVIYQGNSGTQSITGVGFSPDLIWFKNRTTAVSNILYDSVRGANNYLISNLTNAEAAAPATPISFEADGFNLLQGYNGSNQSPDNYVAWCWDAGSSTVSNTDGSITSSVRANTDSGFSIVSFNFQATGNQTIGHGLGSAPKMIIMKSRDSSADAWWVYHESIGATNYLRLNSTNASSANSGVWSTTPTSSVFTIGSLMTTSNYGTSQIAYCFSEVAGYSKFGSYTGTGASGNTITTGFRPAFVMIKRTDSIGNWIMIDNIRSVNNPKSQWLNANTSDAEGTSSASDIDFDDNGFTLQNTNADRNGSGNSYIYMAFADTRDAQFNFDASGNKNNWTANNINSNASSESTYDIMNDVPTLTDEDTANFPILNTNLRDFTYLGLINASLQTVAGGVNVWQTVAATMAVPTSGKYYWEAKFEALSGSNPYAMIGLLPTYYSDVGSNSYAGHTSLPNGFSYYLQNGYIYYNGTNAPYGSTATVGDVIGVAVDADNGKVWFSKNGTWQNSGDPTNGNDTNDATSVTGQTYDTTEEYYPTISNYNGSQVSINFGQQPFKYTPPTGYKKLNTYNLPDSNIVDGSQYFDAVTYTGDGLSTKTIDSFEFAPDLVWTKNRGSTYNHLLFDTIRGADKFLKSNDVVAEGTTTYGNQFLSNGYEFNTASVAWNENGVGHVMWAWRGSDSSAVTNTDGTITSTVSANPTAGFSIVTWAGDGTSGQSVGHGLNQFPEMVIIKKRNKSENWYVASELTYGRNYAYHAHLNTTGVWEGNNDPYYLGGQTSSTTAMFLADGTSNNGGNENGINYVAYCWHSVEGFSKIGSYTGNGSTDGPFIYTGFRPAFLLVKKSSGTGGWAILDTARDTYNEMYQRLEADSNGAEVTSATYLDTLSNGFKIKTTNGTYNGTFDYIYMAFAENPFKNSLAR